MIRKKISLGLEFVGRLMGACGLSILFVWAMKQLPLSENWIKGICVTIGIVLILVGSLVAPKLKGRIRDILIFDLFPHESSQGDKKDGGNQ